MAVPFRKVAPGDKLVIDATTWNAMIDAARRARREGLAAASGADRPAEVLVKNDTGTAQDRFAVLGLANPYITPDDNLPEFKSRITFTGIVPVAGTHEGKFCVLQEALASGGIGRALLSGLTICKVTGDAADFAEIEGASTAHLKMSAAGSARVLWAESGSTERWAVVRFGDGAAGGTVELVTNVCVVYGGVVVEYTTFDLATWTVQSVRCETNPSDCCADVGVHNECCPNDTIPRRLYAHFTDDGTNAGLDGVCVPLDYGTGIGFPEFWFSGTDAATNGVNGWCLSLLWYCGATTNNPGKWRLDVNPTSSPSCDDPAGMTNTSFFIDVGDVTCSPFSATLTLSAHTSVTIDTDPCGGGVTGDPCEFCAGDTPASMDFVVGSPIYWGGNSITGTITLAQELSGACKYAGAATDGWSATAEFFSGSVIVTVYFFANVAAVYVSNDFTDDCCATINLDVDYEFDAATTNTATLTPSC